jgi:uncharacterized repeat protein (TIGR02543 family)
MGKKLLTLGIAVVMLFSLAGLTACNSVKIVETEYFHVRLYKNEGYAVVWELTDLGKEQEILAVPMFIEGLPVKQLGRQVITGTRNIVSYNLVKLYIPHTVEKIIGEITISPDSKFVVNRIDIQDDYFNGIRYGTEGRIIHLNYLNATRPNVAFFSNNYESPNQGYYWYDYVTDTNLYLIPPNPTRSGYDFVGWYLEPKGITQWDEQMPTSADETLNLYAKWQEK